jgi:hypothetical protein
MSIETLLSKPAATLTLERAGESAATAQGDRTQAWSTLFSGIPCWPQPANAGIRAAFGQRQIAVTHQIYVQTDLGCLEGDRITIGSTIYLVKGFINCSGLNVLWRIEAEERR